MKKISQLGLLALMITVGASLAQAQFVLNPNLTYSSSKTEGPTVGSGEVSGFSLDLRAGFLMPSGLFLGGTYGYESYDFGATSDQTFSSLAPTVGYFADGFLAMFSYHFMATAESSPTKLKEGSGTQFDIGYVLPVTSSFHLGPQFRWRSIEFAKMENGGAEVAEKNKMTELSPMISLWFMF